MKRCVIIHLAVAVTFVGGCKPGDASDANPPQEAKNAPPPTIRPTNPQPADAASRPTPARAAGRPLNANADPEADTGDPMLARGKAAFRAGMCFKCHLDDGSGSARAPNLTDDEWHHCDGSVEGILSVLKSGVSEEDLVDPSRPFAMNPVTNLVPDEGDLRALAVFVHSLSTK